MFELIFWAWLGFQVANCDVLPICGAPWYWVLVPSLFLFITRSPQSIEVLDPIANTQDICHRIDKQNQKQLPTSAYR